MLEVTAATCAEIRAKWLDALRRLLDQLFNLAENGAALHALNARSNAVTRRHKSDKQRPSFKMAKPETARNDPFHHGFNDVAWYYANPVALLRHGHRAFSFLVVRGFTFMDNCDRSAKH